MINQVAIIIAPNWRDYGEKYLQACVASLRRQQFGGSFKLFLTDNESTEKSRALIHELAPEIEIIANQENKGFCQGNNEAIKKAMAQGFEYLVLLNMDTEVEPDWLQKLVDAASQAENWGAIQSRIMLWPEKDKINSLGNSLHYLGFGFSAGGHEVWGADNQEKEIKEIAYFSGCSVLLKKDILEAVGFFDEVFWMYHDDLELSWKLRLLGYKIYLAPRSVVYHKYEFAKSIKQYYFMERNRLIFLLTAYEIWTLFLILPMWMIMELGLLVFALFNGFWQEKIKVYGWFLETQNWRYLRRRRQQINQSRQKKDRDLIKYLSAKIEFQEIDNWVLREIGNPLLAGYWWLIKKII
jgi:GT2 family glycosyltransferase